MWHHALEYVSIAGGYYAAWSNRAAHGVFRHTKGVVGLFLMWKAPESPITTMIHWI